MNFNLGTSMPLGPGQLRKVGSPLYSHSSGLGERPRRPVNSNVGLSKQFPRLQEYKMPLTFHQNLEL